MKLIIEKEDVGKRLDNFLMRSVKRERKDADFSRGDFIRSIKKGEVLVNGGKIKPSYSLKENDEVEIQVFPEKVELYAGAVNFEVIYTDENIIVINKPSGVQVHPSASETRSTIANGLISEFPEIAGVGDESSDTDLRPGIVHRLDKDTSGVMVVARNQKSFDELKRMFQDREVQKKYWAVVYGKFDEKEGVIEAPIARASSYKKQVIAGERTKTKIREAVTLYKVLRESEEYSLVEVMPRTGRMHQIRLHMLHIGHPIVGDTVYTTKEIKKNEHPISRQLLHAKEIDFNLFGKDYHFQAPIPEDFDDFMERGM